MRINPIVSFSGFVQKKKGKRSIFNQPFFYYLIDFATSEVISSPPNKTIFLGKTRL